MPYSQAQRNEVIDTDIKTIAQKIQVCRKVKETVDTPGWSEIISPIIDRMIIDVCGGKLGDTWTGGKIDRARKDERREFYIGYKQALIDLHTRIMFHVKQLPMFEEQVQEKLKAKEDRFYAPLLEDSRYAVQK